MLIGHSVTVPGVALLGGVKQYGPAPLTGWPDATNVGILGRALTDNAISALVPGTTYTGQNFTNAGGLSIAAGSGDIVLDHCSHTAGTGAVANLDTNGFGGNLTLQNCELVGAGLSSTQDGNMGIWNRSGCALKILNCYLHELGQSININGSTGPTLIKDTFIQHMLGGSGTHYEAVYYGGGGGAGFSLDIEHCHFINEQVQTSTVFIETAFGAVSNVTLNNSLFEMLGGSDSPVTVDGHNYTNAISGVTITNNTLKILSGGLFFSMRGSDGTLATISGLSMLANVSEASGLTIWSPDETYALNALIEGWDGYQYKSTIANNLNNAQPLFGGSTPGWTSSGGPGFVG
jgi:hypothetical protein